MAEFFQYLPLALTFTNLLTLILGVIGRLILGATPGLSPTMAVALLVPFTFHMDPTTGLILLGSVYTATVAGGADPLGKENVFILCSGPLNGTLAHGSGRTGIVTKSPLSGYFMDSYVGSDLGGAQLKQSGRDMLVIEGKSSKPVVLFCDDDALSLIPADDLWGLDTLAVQDRLREKFGKGISTLCCGPAGENQVLITEIELVC